MSELKNRLDKLALNISCELHDCDRIEVKDVIDIMKKAKQEFPHKMFVCPEQQCAYNEKEIDEWITRWLPK